MKKIVGTLQPFQFLQTLYVYEDGNAIDKRETTINNFPEIITELAKEYNLTDIQLFGPAHYIKGIIHKVQKYELNKYNHNNLIFNIENK